MLSGSSAVTRSDRTEVEGLAFDWGSKGKGTKKKTKGTLSSRRWVMMMEEEEEKKRRKRRGTKAPLCEKETAAASVAALASPPLPTLSSSLASALAIHPAAVCWIGDSGAGRPRYCRAEGFSNGVVNQARRMRYLQRQPIHPGLGDCAGAETAFAGRFFGRKYPTRASTFTRARNSPSEGGTPLYSSALSPSLVLQQSTARRRAIQ
jgi:hypothetical protein